MNSRVLLIDCPDEKGLVSRITGILSRHGLNIVTNWEFVEPESSRFFMRTEVEGALEEDGLLPEMRSVLPSGSNDSAIPITISRMPESRGPHMKRRSTKRLSHTAPTTSSWQSTCAS